MKRILFVDDDKRVLNGLRRQLHARRDEWEMIFAPGGAEALMELGAQRLDVVVTDMCMPVVDGAQVLAHVAHDCPRAARLVLSGDAADDRKRLAKSCAHRYLHKPCETEVLAREIEQALAMRELLDAVSDPRCEEIWARPPGFMDECEAVLDALTLEPPSVTGDVLDLTQDDLALRRRLLELIRGARPEHPAEADDASSLARALGPRCFLGAVMAVRFLENFEPRADECWPRAAALAAAASRLGREHGLEEEVAEDAFVAGLLHHLVEGGDDARRLDLLAYLLPTWGLPPGAVSALTSAPERGLEAAGGAGAALLVARIATGDPTATPRADELRAAGWAIPAPEAAPEA